jgi:hypothetical protein
MGRSFKYTVGALAVGTALAVLGSPALAGAAELPSKDPFYKAPKAGEAHENWQEEAPGTVLKKRALNIFGYNAEQLLFRSNNTHGEPIVAVTTVGIPRNPWTGTGERPLVSFQEAIDSLGSQCNPSYTLQQGSDKEEGEIGSMLERGWYVNVPDHDGEDMEFVAGPNTGHITLDSIRAAQNAGIGISTKNPVGLMGYSGGGESTAFTMEEQPTYAPDLQIAVAAPGGIPVELKEVAEYNDGGPGFGLVIAATIGINRGFPELELYSLLNANGQKTWKEVEGKCLTEYISNPNYGLKKMSEYTKPEYSEPLTLPKVVDVIRHDSLGTAPGQLNVGIPSYPTFLWESAADELIPVAGVDRLADYYCSEGVNVQYDRGAAGEHIAYAIDNAPVAVAYMESVFNAEPEPGTCGVNAATNTKIDSGPSGTAAGRSASLTYSTEPESSGAAFECKLDGGSFETCPEGGVSYRHLSTGAHTFSVRSVTAAGHTDVSPATRTWTVPFLPEFGRCVKVAGTGGFTRGNCIEVSGGHNGKYEWVPGPGPKPDFTGAIASISLRSAAGAVLTCTGGSFKGLYGSLDSEGLSLTFTGCKNGAGKSCQSSPTAAGEIVSSELEGELGFIRSGLKPMVGLQFRPSGTSSTVLAYECREGTEAPTQVAVEGSVVAQIRGINSMKSQLKLVFKASGNKQLPAGFEGLTPAALSITTTSTEGKSEPVPVGLTVLGVATTYITAANEEKVEVKGKV